MFWLNFMEGVIVIQVTMYAATGILGYGFPEESLIRALESRPAFLGCDGGSCDPGPNYLGMGKAICSRGATKRDARLLIKAALGRGIPLIIGSCGGSGSDQGLAWTSDIVEEILAEEGLHAKIARIHSEQAPAYILKKLEEGKISPLDTMPELSADTVKRSAHISAAMGPEPIQAALREGAQIVLAGRATDTSIYAAVPLLMGCPPGPVWHAAKIIECGAACSFPKSHDSMLAHIREDSFILEPPNPEKRVRKINAAAHTMYENVNPYEITEPDGIIDTRECVYEQIDEHRVQVYGSRFRKKPYSVKLEAVESVGFRSICIGGTRDPGLIAILDAFLEKVRSAVEKRVEDVCGLTREAYALTFFRYGRDGVMGAMEPLASSAHEIGILMDVVAPDQELADTIIGIARSLLLHTDFEGRKCNAGNIAFPFSPTDIQVGEVFRFTMSHALWLDDPMEPFRTEWAEV